MKTISKRILLIIFLLLINEKTYSQSNILHLNLGSHNEMSDPQFGVNYNISYFQVKSKLLEIADSVYANNAKWNMQVESNFILACIQQDMANSNSNDIIEKLDNLSYVEVDPHNHLDTVQFNNLNYNPYNYSDLNYLLDSCGLSERSNVGGFLYQANDWETQDANWTLWKYGLQGRTFKNKYWTPKVLWGGGTPNHVNDIFPIGIWHPGGATFSTYMTTNPNEIFAIGNGCRWLIKDTTNVENLLTEIKSFINTINLYPPNENTFYCATIMFDFRNILYPEIVSKISAVLRGIQPLVDESKVVWETLSEKKQSWLLNHSSTEDNFPMICDEIYTLGNNEYGFINNTIKIFPNPANETLSIIFSSNDVKEVNIYDTYGKILYSNKEPFQNYINIHLNEFENGIYFVSLKSKNTISTEKFQVIH